MNHSKFVGLSLLLAGSLGLSTQALAQHGGHGGGGHVGGGGGGHVNAPYHTNPSHISYNPGHAVSHAPVYHPVHGVNPNYTSHTTGTTHVVYQPNNGGRVVYHGGTVHMRENIVVHGGHNVVVRNYNVYRGGRPVTVVRNYNVYNYHGYNGLHVYYPRGYYSHAYYGYYYRPFITPWVYSWGFYSNPWYGHYGYYYHPYSNYIAANYWMTDYLLATMLENRYNEYQIEQAALTQEQIDLAQQRADLQQEQMAISQEQKDQIAIQVQDELAARSTQQTVSLDATLKDPNHIFAISESLDVMPEVEGAQSCTLNQGDLIKLAAVPVDDAQAVSMIVVTSQVGDCKAGSRVTLSIAQLQEIQNEFSAQVDEATDKLKSDPAAQQQIGAPSESLPPAGDGNN